MTTVKKGTKIEGDDAKKLDPKKRALALAAPPAEAEVEGQELARTVTECPWCGHLGYSVVDSEKYNWYECGACGRPFKA
ncbi:hypothetical protein BH09MYX1_BH09MYX1_04220 [soil metagenome]